MKRQVTYRELLKGNPSFRKLLAGQLVSHLGDWFNILAVYTLIYQLSGTAQALAGVLVAKTLPTFFIGPYAGIIVDRFDRRKIMILTDLLRALLVLGFLLIKDPEYIWAVYLILALEMAIASFFEPARAAALPNITSKDELVAANVLSGSAWSIMLAFGAALGGLVTAWLGTNAAFIIDSATFIVSAWFIWRIPSLTAPDSGSPEKKKAKGADFIAGIRYIRKKSIRIALLLAKSGMALNGGIITLFPIYATQVVPSPLMSGTVAIGFLFALRGIGAFTGPMLIRRYFGETKRVMRRSIGVSYLMMGGAYYFFASAPDIWTAGIFSMLGTVGTAAIWFFSTTLAQMEIEDKFRGRFFSLELAIFTAIFAASSWITGWTLDNVDISPREVAKWLSTMTIIPGIMWFTFLLTMKKKRGAPTPVPADLVSVPHRIASSDIVELPGTNIVEEE